MTNNGVAKESQKVVGLWNIPMNLSFQVHLWSSVLWMLEEYGVGLWNITDVLEFPSTLMEQRTLAARGVL